MKVTMTLVAAVAVLALATVAAAGHPRHAG